MKTATGSGNPQPSNGTQTSWDTYIPAIIYYKVNGVWKAKQLNKD